MNHRPSRRAFLGSAAAFAAAPLWKPWSVPRPLGTLNVACIGTGGMGASDLGSVAGCREVRIAALCDVDRNNLDAAAKAHPAARTFADFRVLLDQMGKDIDAVTVSVPDHMHGPIAIAAMQRGKHVYCQKPLAHNLRECRRMMELAAQKGLVTQMGIQIHAHEAYRTAVAALQSGVLGKVRSVHAWVDRSWAGPAGGRPANQDPVPKHLDWDLWLGVAPERPFVEKIYHPANWRGWCDFGTGTLGDMGCHILDPLFTALELGSPLDVISRGPQHGADSFAGDGSVTWTFAATARTAGKIEVTWTDGAARPDAGVAHLPEGVKLPGGGGSFTTGELGVMVLPHWAMPSFYQCGKVLDVAVQKETATNHYQEWTDACRGEGRTSTPFAYSGLLTEAVLAGTVAGRFKDRLLRWDSKAMRFDHEPASAFVGREYRKGWAIQ